MQHQCPIVAPEPSRLDRYLSIPNGRLFLDILRMPKPWLELPRPFEHE
jgi:hypothetical protein